MSDVDRRRRDLRRLTLAATIAAAALNVALLVQTGIGQMGSTDVQGAIVSFVRAIFPGAGPGGPPPSTVTPGATPVVVTGAS